MSGLRKKSLSRTSVYKRIYKKSVEKALSKITKKKRTTIIKRIRDELATNPYKYEKLEGKFVGQRSFQVREYRVIYRINEKLKTVGILYIGPRQGAYK